MIKKIIKGAFIFLAISLAVLALTLAVFFAAKLLLGFDAKGSALDNEKVTDASKDAQKDIKHNFLVMGRDKTSGLCDVLMIVSYNVTDSSVDVVQLPRDTYAEYTSGSYRKLNGALASLGGEAEFCGFLSEALCTSIDYYISLDLDALGEVVDAIGGVEVEVPFDMKYSDPEQGLYINIKKGKNLLDGKTAQQFIRYRSGYIQGDVGRIDAQKIFLTALVNKIRSNFSVLAIGNIITKVAGKVNTNVSATQMVALATEALSVVSEKIRFVTMAGEEAIAAESGASYYVISRPSAMEIVNEFLGGEADEKSFDRDGVFLNEKYESFRNIYNSKKEYKVYTAASIAAEGLKIAHK